MYDDFEYRLAHLGNTDSRVRRTKKEKKEEKEQGSWEAEIWIAIIFEVQFVWRIIEFLLSAIEGDYWDIANNTITIFMFELYNKILDIIQTGYFVKSISYLQLPIAIQHNMKKRLLTKNQLIKYKQQLIEILSDEYSSYEQSQPSCQIIYCTNPTKQNNKKTQTSSHNWDIQLDNVKIKQQAEIKLVGNSIKDDQTQNTIDKSNNCPFERERDVMVSNNNSVCMLQEISQHEREQSMNNRGKLGKQSQSPIEICQDNDNYQSFQSFKSLFSDQENLDKDQDERKIQSQPNDRLIEPIQILSLKSASPSNNRSKPSQKNKAKKVEIKNPIKQKTKKVQKQKTKKKANPKTKANAKAIIGKKKDRFSNQIFNAIEDYFN